MSNLHYRQLSSHHNNPTIRSVAISYNTLPLLMLCTIADHALDAMMEVEALVGVMEGVEREIY